MGKLDSEAFGEEVLKISFADPLVKARALTALELAIDYAGADPRGIVRPLEFRVTGPSAGSFERRFYRRTTPTSIFWTPREGGRHLVTIREVAHNRWWGRLVVVVAGDTLTRRRA